MNPHEKQVLLDEIKSQPVADGTLYNIWYNKYQGGDRQKFTGVEKATTRCVLLKDAGKTRARPHAYFCIHFARGCCSKGSDCQVEFYLFIYYGLAVDWRNRMDHLTILTHPTKFPIVSS